MNQLNCRFFSFLPLSIPLALTMACSSGLEDGRDDSEGSGDSSLPPGQSLLPPPPTQLPGAETDPGAQPGVNGPLEGDNPMNDLPGADPVAAGDSHVVVVAHQDDDLLFINPFLQQAIDAGDALRTAYLTSGNNDLGMDYVLERERGIQAAYAQMAGVNNSWTCASRQYGALSPEVCTLAADSTVEVIFYRLTDGQYYGEASGSLERLWLGEDETSTPIDSTMPALNLSELEASLAALYEQVGMTHLYLTEFAFQEADDHSDHRYAAAIGMTASVQQAQAHELFTHKTYATDGTGYSPNISMSEAELALSTFEKYSACDSKIPGCSGPANCETSSCEMPAAPVGEQKRYRDWTLRNYFSKRVALNTSGHLSPSAGQCLSVGVDGAIGQASSCAASEVFEYTSSYQLATSGGLCLEAVLPQESWQATELKFVACSDSSLQKFILLEDGSLVLAASRAEGAPSEAVQCVSRVSQWSSDLTLQACSSSSAMDWSLSL
ncbi:MAG: PIG-L family deacetylase [Polyangiaceae bacterium]|nr:PIG-L family deacetylase [Polyangiaceae bacterium]